MDFRNVHVVHHQRIMRLCQYHDLYGYVKFRLGQCQHFSCRSVAWLSGQCHSDLEEPENPKVFIPLSAMVLAGSIPGSFLLKNVDASAIKVVFGVMIILLGSEMYLRERHPGKMKNSKIVLAVIGVIAGVLCGLFGVGALLAAYVSRVTDNGSGFKANISMVFLVESTFRIGLYIALKILTMEIFCHTLMLFPFSLLGLWIGMKCSSKMDDRIIKRLIVILLIVSGISLIVTNL